MYGSAASKNFISNQLEITRSNPPENEFPATINVFKSEH